MSDEERQAEDDAWSNTKDFVEWMMSYNFIYHVKDPEPREPE